jgi:hypothetical protein
VSENLPPKNPPTGNEYGRPDDVIIHEALRSVEVDVADGFAGVFSARGFTRDLNGASLDENAVVATTSELVVVPWVYSCTHVGEFLGVPPTYIELELRGTTFVHATGPDPEAWDYYRYIDFVGALQQLGVTTTSRPALTADEYDNWRLRQGDANTSDTGTGDCDI